MLAGTNWILGYSHTGPAADKMIQDRHSQPESIAEIMDAYMQYGIDAVMAPTFDQASPLRRGMELTQERFGKKKIQIVTPGINVDDNAAARAEAEATTAAAR